MTVWYLIYPKLFFPLSFTILVNASTFFHCEVKNTGVIFDISLFSHHTANTFANAVIIPLIHAENVTSWLHCHHSNSSPLHRPTLGLWWNPGTTSCSVLVTWESVFSTVITGMLNRPDHFSSPLKPATEFPTHGITRPYSDLPGPHSLPPLSRWRSLFSALFTAVTLVTSLLLGHHKHSPAFRPMHLLKVSPAAQLLSASA